MPDGHPPKRTHATIGGITFTVAESYDEIIEMIERYPALAVNDDDLLVPRITLTAIYPNNQTARLSVAAGGISTLVDITTLNFEDMD